MQWNRPPRATIRLLTQASERLASYLPPDWRVDPVRRAGDPDKLRIVSPTGEVIDLAAWAQKEWTPRFARDLADPEMPALAVGRWLSPRTREVLGTRGIGFVDLTGNADLVLSSPTVVIRAEGAQRDPQPKPTEAPSLRGPRAWALLRTIAEVEPPFGVRELASATGLDAGYISRILGVLEEEVFIAREPRGPVIEVEWEGLLRRHASIYSLLDSNVSTSWVAAGGPDGFLDDIADVKRGRRAVTGSFGAARLAPVAAPTVTVVYTSDPDRLARVGRLLPADRGANVILLEPYDGIVFERTWRADGVHYASVAQLAIDCLTGMGRMPSEGEALLDWMRKNLGLWRATSLEDTASPLAHEDRV